MNLSSFEHLLHFVQSDTPVTYDELYEVIVSVPSESRVIESRDDIVTALDRFGRVDRFSDGEALPYISIALGGNKPDDYGRVRV